MNKYSVTFEQEKQFFFGNPSVIVIIDGEKVCELKIKTGDSVKTEITEGKHQLVITGAGKRVDTEIFVREEGTIKTRWNKTWGVPEIIDLGKFDPANNVENTSVSDNDL